MSRRPPRSTLFPYQPLFQSRTGCALSTVLLPMSEPKRADCARWRRRLPRWFAKHPDVRTVFLGQLATTDLPFGEQVEGYRSEEHTSELQSRQYFVCRLLLEK